MMEKSLDLSIYRIFAKVLLRTLLHISVSEFFHLFLSLIFSRLWILEDF